MRAVAGRFQSLLRPGRILLKIGPNMSDAHPDNHILCDDIDTREANFEKINRELLLILPRDQRERVFNQDRGDIGPEFLGFVDIYVALAKIIPVHWTVVDLGCAYAPQAFLFKGHAKYVGVDLPGSYFDREGGMTERFVAPNSMFYEMTIADFCERHASEFDQETTFAICSYVPPWYGDNCELARRAFRYVFTYYPGGETKVILRRARDHPMVFP